MKKQLRAENIIARMTSLHQTNLIHEITILNHCNHTSNQSMRNALKNKNSDFTHHQKLLSLKCSNEDIEIVRNSVSPKSLQN